MIIYKIAYYIFTSLEVKILLSSPCFVFKPMPEASCFPLFPVQFIVVAL